MKKDKPLFTFDEALALLHVGAYGFRFTNSAGDKFAVDLDHNVRPKVEPVEETEE